MAERQSRGGRPELADIVRAHGAAFRATHGLCSVQHRVLTAIECCRTAALGGELRACDACGERRYVYHSCRNRHCPKCQTRAKEAWLAARRAELLPVPYFHLVFTLPHELNALAQGNPHAIYTMLFAAASETLLEFGSNPRWLGGSIAATLVLHTWGQTLSQHLHVHALVAAGALAVTGSWIRSRRGFLFPVKALSAVFRGKFLAALKLAFSRAGLMLSGATSLLADPCAQRALFCALRAKAWVVYAKRPFAGPAQVLDYLGRYTHRTAISNERIVAMDAGRVHFRFKDYAQHDRRRTMALDAHEFLRRFALHVLPRGFMRIRHYGLLANRNKRALLAAARRALDAPVPALTDAPPESVADFWQRAAGIDITRCTHCGIGTLHLMTTIAPPTPAASVSTTRFIGLPLTIANSHTPREDGAHPPRVALTLLEPSAIVHASPFAPRHSAPTAHASLAALFFLIAEAFIPQA